MSDYYDLFVAVDLPPDLSESVLSELRWHVGLTESAPLRHTAVDFEGQGRPWPVFASAGESHGFPGVDGALLMRRVNWMSADGGAAPWALTMRTCVHEDDLGTTVDALTWLLRHATTRGWVGYLRGPEPEAVHHLVSDTDGFEVVGAQSGNSVDQHSLAVAATRTAARAADLTVDGRTAVPRFAKALSRA